MATKPIEYRIFVRGFGGWRIAYDPAAKNWALIYEPHYGRNQEPQRVNQFSLAEAAAIAVAEQNTGMGMWDDCGFGRGMDFELSRWKTDESEGVQADASD